MNLQKICAVKFYAPAVFRKRLNWILAVVLLLTPSYASAYDLLIGTGKAGSFSYFSGRMLCRTIHKEIPDINCSVRGTADEIDNLTNLQAGSLDLAIINSNVLDGALNKSGQFQFLDINYSNLSILTPLYARPIGIMVQSNAGISSLNDLKGKRINAGAPGSVERRAMELILKAKGWTASDFKRFEELPTSHAQDTMAFCQGTVQAMITVGVHPSKTTRRLIENCKGAVLDINDDAIDELVDSRASCWETEIKVSSDSIPSRTFGTRAILVASNAIDQKTGYAITKALYKNKKRLQKSHPALSLFPVEESRKGIKGLQLHTGAEQFFTEQ